MAAGISVSRAGGDAFELLGPDGVVVRIDEPTMLVLELFDGVSDVDRVTAAAAGRGLRARRADVARLADTFQRAGLLVDATDLPRVSLPGGRVACASCAFCCHLAVGPLEPDDVQRIGALDWAAHGLAAPDDWLRGRPGDRYLAQGDDHACVFLDDDNLCRIHRVFGEEQKPRPCRLFPLSVVRRAGEVRVGLSYECHGMHHAWRAGGPVGDEAARLEDVLGVAMEGYSVLPAVDPDGRLWRAVAGPPEPGTPAAALQALIAAVTPLMDDGDLGLATFLRDLAALATAARDAAPSPFLRDGEARVVTELEGLLRGERPPGAGGSGPEPIAPFYLGFLRNRVFLGEPMGRLGAAAGLAVLCVQWLVASRLAARNAAAAGRAFVSLEDAADGLATAVGGFRCTERIDEIAGAGAGVLRELAGALRA